ncbi:hypothetical protein M404DRAFT_26951 [Pisolithus tinctorius Marx 270]|uniref:Uncharacterized protein n=1 Tax=Pisolithus tinctorius Marx 270 TaxID=870435 RepID=A0A0C3P7L8_PISTI|nr:hypothetical protein M404DRAFT_26951 [Pisolithus tinctorius Marx 270]
MGRNLFTIKASDLRIVHDAIDPMEDPLSTSRVTLCLPVVLQSVPPSCAEAFVLFFHADIYKAARKFWEHCGLGISSQYAERCPSILGISGFPKVEVSEFFRVCGKTDLTPKSLDVSEIPLMTGADAKDAFRQRIANYFVRDESPAGAPTNISMDDVFLFSCGMPALWNVRQLSHRALLGKAFYLDIDDLDATLERKVAENPSTPPILVLHTECSSKPLLFTVNIPRLGALADKYDFLVVFDESAGTFANPFKILGQISIVLDGSSFPRSLVINPRMIYHALLREHLASTFEDTYFTSDATVMDRTSRDFFELMHIVNANTGYICEFLRVHSIEGGASESEGAVTKQVWYPKYITPENYQSLSSGLPNAELVHENRGYGDLFSLMLTSLEASRAFYDALEVAKGRSLLSNQAESRFGDSARYDP